jgi:hypothetical protein
MLRAASLEDVLYINASEVAYVVHLVLSPTPPSMSIVWIKAQLVMFAAPQTVPG